MLISNIDKVLESPTCQAPIFDAGFEAGRCDTSHNLNASALISNTLLTMAQNAANGYTDENRNTYPNCMKISKQSSTP